MGLAVSLMELAIGVAGGIASRQPLRWFPPRQWIHKGIALLTAFTLAVVGVVCVLQALVLYAWPVLTVSQALSLIGMVLVATACGLYLWQSHTYSFGEDDEAPSGVSGVVRSFNKGWNKRG